MAIDRLFDDLAGKTVLVTGASGGLGAHFARLLASYGASVVLGARRVDQLGEVAEAIRASGGMGEAMELDVTDVASIAPALRKLGRPLDILVNNAGVADAVPALEIEVDGWDRTFDTNLRGAFLLSQAAAEGMRERQSGTIVNVASILAMRPAGSVAAYAASKSALVQLTRSLALEWARYGIRVNALCPGYICTEMNAEFFASPPGQAMIRRIPQRRLGRPQDLDGAMLLLCSEAGSFITGASLAVDGGHLVSSL